MAITSYYYPMATHISYQPTHIISPPTISYGIGHGTHCHTCQPICTLTEGIDSAILYPKSSSRYADATYLAPMKY